MFKKYEGRSDWNMKKIIKWATTKSEEGFTPLHGVAVFTLIMVVLLTVGYMDAEALEVTR